MTERRAEDLQVHPPWTTPVPPSSLAGANPEDFAAALWEQKHLVERAITDAGFSAEQARLAAGHFGVAVREE